jgi:hypothetical protein
MRGFVFDRTGNLVAPLWIHMLYNGLGLFLATRLGDTELDIPTSLLAATAAISLGLAALVYSQLRNEQAWTLDPIEESDGK